MLSAENLCFLVIEKCAVASGMTLMVLLWLELWTAYLNACIIQGLGRESGAMARVLLCWSSSRSSFGCVTVIIIRIFSYIGFLKPSILRGLECENCDMA